MSDFNYPAQPPQPPMIPKGYGPVPQEKQDRILGLAPAIISLCCLPVSYVIALTMMSLAYSSGTHSYSNGMFAVLGFGWVWALGFITALMSIKPKTGQPLWFHVSAIMLSVLSLFPLLLPLLLAVLRANGTLSP